MYPLVAPQGADPGYDLTKLLQERKVDEKGLVGTEEASEQGLRALARGVFDELSSRLGERLETSARERRLFAEHGPALMEAWDEFRRRAGARAPSHPFRDELRARYGVELFPPGDA